MINIGTLLADVLLNPILDAGKILFTGDRKGFQKFRSFAKSFHLEQVTPLTIRGLDQLSGEVAYPTLYRSSNTNGNLDLESLYALMKLAISNRPKTIFEIGTFNGNTALQFAVNLPLATVHTLDLPVKNLADQDLALPLAVSDDQFVGALKIVYEKTDYAPRISQHYGDSAAFDFRPFHGQVDLFYIDGAHSYEYVKSDTLNAFKCLAPGGIIVWDDYGPGWPGVINYLNELSKEKEIIWIRGTSLCVMFDNSRAEL